MIFFLGFVFDFELVLNSGCIFNDGLIINNSLRENGIENIIMVGFMGGLNN